MPPCSALYQLPPSQARGRSVSGGGQRGQAIPDDDEWSWTYTFRIMHDAARPSSPVLRVLHPSASFVQHNARRLCYDTPHRKPARPQAAIAYGSSGSSTDAQEDQGDRLGEAMRDRMSSARGPRQGCSLAHAIPGPNLLPGGRQDGKGIYDSPRGARRHPGH
jgi:hypothetical protein